MTRKEWYRFYSTFRTLIRVNGRGDKFWTNFNTAMNSAVNWRRQVELFVNGKGRRIWYFAVDIYFPF